MRIDQIGHPAGELQTIAQDSLGTEQGVIDATQAHTHHQNHRQLQINR